MLIYIQSLIAVFLGIISLITDVKDKKIYNKNIIIAIIVSSFIYAIFWKQIDIIYFKNYVINIIISLFISFIFYYFKIWSAGDAKLFLAIIYMIPFEIYENEIQNFFPGLYILILIFSSGFLYVVFETILLWLKDNHKLKIIKEINVSKEEFISFITKYFMGYFIVLFINNIVFKIFEEFRHYNAGLILLGNMLLLLFIYRVINDRKKMILVTLIFVIANICYYTIFGLEIYSISLKMIILVLVIMFFRIISEKYNYEEIEIDKLKPRMILSYGSVILFYGSRVQGLPKSTDESTDSRLSEEEVNSIKRWSKTKRGRKNIVIVRHMPFAPFMLVGQLIFWMFKLYL